jgi:hypothetical protein
MSDCAAPSRFKAARFALQTRSNRQHQLCIGLLRARRSPSIHIASADSGAVRPIRARSASIRAALAGQVDAGLAERLNAE